MKTFDVELAVNGEAVRPWAVRQLHRLAQFAEVAVDPGSGEVGVRRLVGVFAAGRIVNPVTARSQFIGG